MTRAIHIKQKQIEAPPSEIVEVTPDIAREWLRTNEHNRDVKQRKVADYTDLMEQGRWQDAHPDHIIFDDHGRLINGQHRLLALIRANKTLRFRVLRGLPEATAHTIDTPALRTIRDSYTISEGESIDAKTASIVPRFLAGLYVQKTTSLPYFRDELLGVFRKYRPAIEEVSGWFSTHTVRGLTRVPVRAAVVRAYVALPDHRERLHRFVEVLMTGQYDRYEEDGAAAVLRDLLVTKSRRMNGSEIDIYARTEAAIEAFVQRRSMGRTATIAKRELFAIDEDSLYS